MSANQLDHDKYSAYLNEHLLAADAGVQAFKAAADTWADTEWEQVFQQIHEELTDSHARVKQLIEELGYDVSKLRSAVAGVAGVLGRINPLNFTRSNDGLMTQLEIDALVAAVRAQQMMWETLLVLCPIDPRLDSESCQQMIDRCEDQRSRIHAMNEATAQSRFTVATDE